MTPEERLARLEAVVEGQGRTLARIDASLAELVRVAAMGRGALWLMLKMGAAVVVGLGLAKLILDFVSGRYL